jgi:hypothetical protein
MNNSPLRLQHGEDAKSLGNFSFLGSNRMENLLKLHI